jgi:Coenzyme PQQ synthesis protein D (PqqD)
VVELAGIRTGSVVAAVPDHVSSKLGEEAVILHVTKGVYYGLNEVGATVWNLIQEPRSVGELCDEIIGDFDIDRDTCEREVTALLERLLAEGLIQVSDVPAHP